MPNNDAEKQIEKIKNPILKILVANYCDKEDLTDKYVKEYITEHDYDKYVEATAAVPALKPGKTTTIKLEIPGHWVYDSNCELEAFIDVDNEVEEANETNNKLQYFAWG